MNAPLKQPAPRNKTLSLTDTELRASRRFLSADFSSAFQAISDTGYGVVNGDFCALASTLPPDSIDLAIVDPPYNLTKVFDAAKFKKTSATSYEDWVDSWMPQLARGLKSTGSIYVCSDWNSSSTIHAVLSKYFVVRNRITWERDKGRGALKNWKNNCEDVWFCTKSDDYTFNLDAVKVKKKVVAPYRDANGVPKDWTQDEAGDFRMTSPSNVWTDITVPFWSMPENTEHPTQKPEKLFAKLVLASSNAGDMILDPFLGSGTTAVVAKKLNRQCIGVEVSDRYCGLALKRLLQADQNREIQGFDGTFFHERNAGESLAMARAKRTAASAVPYGFSSSTSLF
jgi:site-specific DNA-methyltransferase (adenine-specific)